MLKRSLYGAIAAITLAAGMYSCNRVNGIDNDQVVQTPYSLYFADSAGAVYNSNDGFTKKVIFRADGKPCRALCIAGNNVMIIKDHVYYSTDNGVNFNHSYDSASQVTLRRCGSENGLPLNQTMVLEIPEPSWTRTYLASADASALSSTIIGVAMTLNPHGQRGSWYLDRGDSTGSIGLYPIFFHSFTRMENGYIVAYDAQQNRVYYRNENILWVESTGNDAGRFGVGAPARQTGNGLPDTASYLGHINNRVIALINDCPSHGAWYSDDTGRNWTAYSGLPQNDLLCISAPFEQTCLVGTRGAGLYVLNLNTGSFQQNINGLAANLTVRSIAAKKNIFKNGTVKRYIYLSTDKGIYQSVDNGINWTRTLEGNYTAMY